MTAVCPMAPMDLVHALLAPTAPPAPLASVEALRGHAAAGPADTIARAALGGFAAAGHPGLAGAFASGYEAALARLDPEAGRGGRLAALCATEDGSAHPRAIRTTLAPAAGGGWALDGCKSWVTLGEHAELLLVVASTGLDAQGRNRLRVARIPAARQGVRVEPGGATPFAPESGHARVALDGVAVAEDELLAGDGYDAVLKPFRTVEDAHVMAALVGWAIGVARASHWERAFLEEATGIALVLHAVATADPSRPETHVALAGAIASTRRLLEGAPWDRADSSLRAGWERDRALLDVASRVRAARLESAWRALG
jgi:alkylation response protein AidB-like acyl-CoA dehydrogenase